LRGRTAEDVAREANYKELVEALEMERFNAPAQLCYKNDKVGVRIWCGAFGALDPEWSSDVGITEVVCLPTTLSKPTNMEWLKDDETCKHLVHVLDADDDDTSEGSFVEFRSCMTAVIVHVLDILKKGDCELLICDPTGLSSAPALLAVALLLKYQTSITTTLADMAVARPALKMSKSLRRGLETIQMDFNEKKLKRLDAKIRNAVILSNGF
jgi:hypothetical protein